MTYTSRDLPSRPDTPVQLASVLLIFFAACALVAWYHATGLPILRDNQHYFYVSERIASGFSPYVTEFDTKHALSMMLSGAAIAAGRSLGFSDLASARFISAVAFGAAASLVWLIAACLSGTRRAAWFAVLVLFSSFGYTFLAAMGARPKVFLVTFMSATILLVCRRAAFWSGFCASLSFLCWQPALLLLGALIVTYALRPRRLHSMGAAILGALLPLLLYESYFIYMGTLAEQLRQAYYVPARLVDYEFLGLAGTTLSLARHWCTGYGKFNFIPVVFVISLVVYWLRFIRTRQDILLLARDQPGCFYFQLCMYGSLAFTYYNHQRYPDLLFILPFMAIVVAWGLDNLAESGPFKNRRAARRAVVLVLMALATAALFRNRIDWEAAQFTYADQERLAKTVKQWLKRGDSVYVIGCTHLLAFIHAANWSRYGFFFPGVDNFVAQETGAEFFRPVKDGKWPAIILLSRNPPRGWRNWLPVEYVDMTTEEFARQEIAVWKRRAAAGPVGGSEKKRGVF